MDVVTDLEGRAANAGGGRSDAKHSRCQGIEGLIRNASGRLPVL